MSDHMNFEKASPVNGSDRRLSQAVFVTVGAGIFIGGLWMLYQGDRGPYHPDDAPFEPQTQPLVSD